MVDPVHAEIGDREGAVFEVGLLQLGVAGTGDEIRPGRGDLGDAEPVGAADHRHDEAAVDGDRNSDVRGRSA